MKYILFVIFFFFSSRRRHTRFDCDWSSDVCSSDLIAEVIERKFRVRYHRDHVGRLMHSLKWSPQKPERRALERKDAEIERWKKEEWPRVKKTLRGWAPTSYLPTNRAFS